jgi:ribonuclease-3
MADMSELRSRLGFDVSDELLTLAMTHRSYSYENGNIPTNERLEFLGDSVLGIVVTDTLYRLHPNEQEGQLAKLRAAVVNARALAEVAQTVGLGEFLFLGRGEETTDGRSKPSILADTCEAVIGAVYISGGIEWATALVHQWLDPLIEVAATLGAGLDWKTSLQELTSEFELGAPLYVIEETGPDHAKNFTAQVKIGEDFYGNGNGRSKKEAEQHAAATAFHVLSEQHKNA